MKKLLFIFIIFLSITAYADQIELPFSCYPKQVQAKFAEAGYKLDLSANDREEDSWGFIESKGSTFNIFTYRQIDIETLNDIQKIVMEK